MNAHLGRHRALGLAHRTHVSWNIHQRLGIARPRSQPGLLSLVLGFRDGVVGLNLGIELISLGLHHL